MCVQKCYKGAINLFLGLYHVLSLIWKSVPWEVCAIKLYERVSQSVCNDDITFFQIHK